MSLVRLRKFSGALLFIALLVLGWAGWPRQAVQTAASASRDLPTDAEMISHFQAHRADFDELVRLYQSDQWRVWQQQDGKLLPFETEAYKGLAKRVGTLGLGSDGAIWLPDPHAVETANKAWAMDLFHAYSHHGIIFYMGNRKFSSSLGRMAWKNYFYVPVVPRVENGELWWPVDRNGRVYRKSRVFTSLDEYPSGWFFNPPQPRRGECVDRPIEPQWFLTLCDN